MSTDADPQTVTTFNEYDIYDRYNGYLKLVKMIDVISTVPADSIVTESKQAHGFKRIIYTTSGSHDITRFMNAHSFGSGVDLRVLTQTEFDTIMQSGVDKDGDYALGVGTFDANEGEDILINIHGQHIIRSSPDGYAIEMYDTDFATLLTKISVEAVGTGTYSNVIVSGVGGGAGKIELMIGEDTRFIIEDGKITLSGTTLEFALTDLHVLGNLWVTNATVLSGTQDVEGHTTLLTVESSGKAQLEGAGATFNIVSS